ncbi:type II toxin-antitoxin system PemK/MazF family toxin [Clostridium sporogenes]|nr:toxin-antitoxin system, toxin component, MazF family [Clostridium sporogenes ATCC 15579]NFE67408.1 type II toxin-antitoxin system PemK/MazF family toxin [Clostridium sporogenes]NFF65373.1 type II toxin-antitoxin system PemK/MazF family toxin [Clostridium sporogenes]NFG03458.1 type II toxin-antitoxin system PemK/MazF family toxin [Clostridium sporogenes]NFH48894.1 type II toxin-antitoxin system PemK/MazF family toxin [Clostridium sporogenes]
MKINIIRGMIIKMLNKKVRRGDIIEVNLGTPKGSRQGGIRPCIVVANDLCNKYSKTIHVVPITSKLNKKLIPTHVFIKRDNLNNLRFDSLILVEQTQLIGVNQILKYNLGKISDEIIKKIDIKLNLQFSLSEYTGNLNKKKIDEKRILAKVKSIKELEYYIDRQEKKSVDLLKILKSTLVDFKEYCKEFNVDYSNYYLSKFNTINIYMQNTDV